MNTLQIEHLLKKDLKSKAIFKKVCALDQLEKPTFPSAYVINSDPSSEPGEHWVAVYFDKRVFRILLEPGPRFEPSLVCDWLI